MTNGRHFRFIPTVVINMLSYQLPAMRAGWALPALLLSVVTSVAAETPATDDPMGFSATARHPVVTVPTGRVREIGGGKPQIDGKLDHSRDEWNGTACLHDLIGIYGEDPGVAGFNPTRVWLTYDADALYVAFVTELPDGVTPNITVTEGHDKGTTDDAFEIFLQPDLKVQKFFHVGGSAGGVTWERTLPPAGGGLGFENWDPKVKYAAQVLKDSWSGEFEIPWSEMGLAAPKPGEVWRANFVANRRAPAHRLESWSWWTKWNDQVNNGYLIFGKPEPEQPFMTFQAGWKQAWRDEWPGFWPNIGARNWGDRPPAQIEATVQLLHKELDPSNPDASYYTDLQKRRDAATGEGATFTTLEQDLAETLKPYKPVHDQRAEVFAMPHEDRRSGAGPQLKVQEDGDYVLRYYYRDVTDKEKPVLIAGGALPFRVRSSLQVAVQPFILSRRSVVAMADMRALGNDIPVAKLCARIAEKGQTQVLAERALDYAGGKRVDIEVPIDKLPVDKRYTVTVEAIGPDGKVASAAAADFNRPPDPDWWVNRHKYGAEPEVPQPWTPVEWKDGVAKIWGRAITLGEQLLPQQINSIGEDILAGPIRLDLVRDGQRVEWSKAKTKVTEQRPGRLAREAVMTAGGVRLRAASALEFDGLLECNLYVEPADQPVTVEALELVIPFKAEHARFMANYAKAPGPGKSFPRFGGKTPDRYTSPVMITTWLGTEERGLEWSCESARDWALDGKKIDETIVIERKGDVVEARFRFVMTPTTLDRSRHWRFGLFTTPAKPLPPETLNWKIDTASVSPRPAGYPTGSGFKKQEDGTIVMDDYAKSDEAAVAAFLEYYKGYEVLTFFQPYDWAVTNGRGNPWPTKVTDPTLLEFYRNQEKTFRERGIVALRYGGWGVWKNGPEWDPWGQEMLMSPKTPTIWEGSLQTFQSPFVEWYIGSWAQNARNTGVRGVRFDTQFPWHDSASPYYGEAWVSDIDGKTRGYFSLFRARELTKRLYRIFNGGEVEGGIIYHPAGGPPMMLIESFVTLRETGEGPYMHGKSLKEAYPQEMMRVMMSGKPYGLVELHNLKGSPLHLQNRLGACLAAGIRPRLLKRPGSDTRSYTPHVPPTTAIYDAWAWIDRATAQWHPHWQNQELVTTSSDAGEHYVSFNLQRGKRVLLVATNYEPKDATVTVKLDLSKLGFASDTTLVGQDAITGEPVEIKDGTLRLSCGPELYRYVKIGLH